MLSFCLKLLHTYVYKYIYDVKKIIFEEFLSSICLSNWQWVKKVDIDPRINFVTDRNDF